MDDRNSILDRVDDDDEIIIPAANRSPQEDAAVINPEEPLAEAPSGRNSDPYPLLDHPFTDTIEDAARILEEQTADVLSALPEPLPIPNYQPKPYQPGPPKTEVFQEQPNQQQPAAKPQVDQLAEITARLDEIMQQNAAFKEQLAHISMQYTQILQRIDDTNQSVSAHNAIESRMGEELERYKKGLYSSIAEPFISQLVTIHVEMERDLKKEEAALAKLPEDVSGDLEREKSNVLISTLEFYLKIIKGALSNCGVELLNPEVGMPMDQLRYAIARTVPTDNPELHSCIAEVKACGYAYNNKVLRPAKVDVYKSNHL